MYAKDKSEFWMWIGISQFDKGLKINWDIFECFEGMLKGIEIHFTINHQMLLNNKMKISNKYFPLTCISS